MAHSSSASQQLRLLLAGQALSWLGDAVQPLTLAVAILTTGGGAGDLGLVLAAGMVARLVCTLLGGVWADRLAPTRIMLVSDLVRAAAVGAMAMMFAFDRHDLLALCLLSAVLGGAAAFFSPAFVSLRPLLVAPERRRSANATVTLLQSGSYVVGPAVGGVLVATAGPVPAFGLNAVTFLVSAATVCLIRARPVRGPRGGLLADVRQGWAEVRSRDWLLAGVVSAGVFHVAFGAVAVLANVVAIRQLGGASAAGLIASATGAGGALGALIAMRTRPRRPLATGFVALIGMPVYVLAFAGPAPLPVVVLVGAAAFAGLMFFSVCWETALQDHVPHDALGRVSSWDILTSFVGIPMGNAVAGPLAGVLGTPQVLVVAAVITGVAALAPLALDSVRRLGAAAPVATARPAILDA